MALRSPPSLARLNLPPSLSPSQRECLLNHAANSSEGGDRNLKGRGEREREFVVIYSTFEIDLEPYLYARGKEREISAFDLIHR